MKVGPTRSHTEAIIEHRHGGFLISTNRDLLDLEVIRGFLTNSYWAKGISREIVARSIEHSLCFGIYDANGSQVGCSRVVSDRATYAYLRDVFVLQSHRGRGLCYGVIEFILTHPRLQCTHPSTL